MNRFAVLTGFLALLVAVSGGTPPAAVQAQDGEKQLKLRWYGQSYFQLETAGGKLIVFDPHSMPVFAPPRLSADVTLVSHPHDDHNQIEVLKEKGRDFQGVTVSKDGKKTDWNVVDEKVGVIRVRTLGTFHDTMNGMQRGKNSVWIVEVDSLSFVHLGDLGHELSEAQIKAIGKVDVLMVPVGGIYTINGEQAQTVVAKLKPRLYVLPMHYGVPGYDDIQGPGEFLDGYKTTMKDMTTTNELVIPADMKAPDAPVVVQLSWKKAAPKVDPKDPPKKP